MVDEPKVEEGRVVTVEEARAMMAQEKQNRGVGCNQAIQAALAKYNCGLVAIPSIAPDGTIKAQIQIVPKD